MPLTRIDVALLTIKDYLSVRDSGDWYNEQVLLEDRLLTDALHKHGLSASRLDWADPDFDWASTRCAMFRTTWDYHHRFGEFSQWLDSASTRTTLINDITTVRWNMDKHYLADLEHLGIEIVPTQFVQRGETASLAAIADRAQWNEIVIKPAVSGGARETYRAAGDEISALQERFEKCIATEAMLIQPFQPEIVAQGEISLMVIAGKFTHAIRKTAKVGDFRVQDDHGGIVHNYEPTAAEIAFAERATAACNPLPIYARVDIVTTPQGCRLMELELVEPELFFRFHPPSAEATADAIALALQ